MRPVRPLAALLVLALVVPLAACSGTHGARAWATAVCTSLSPWRAEIGSLTSRVQMQMSAATTPGQAKENLMRLFAGGQDATERARAGVAQAGVPDVTGGKEIAARFTGSLAAVRDAYGKAEQSIEALATAPAGTFYPRVEKVVDQFNQDYSAGSLDTSKLSSEELKQAFDEVPECR